MTDAWSIESLPDAFGGGVPPKPPPSPPKPEKGDRLDAVPHGGRPVVNLYQPKPAGTGEWSINDLPDYDPKTDTQDRQVGAGEAAVRGAVDTASFGLAPVLVGLQEAGQATPQGRQATEAMAGVASEAPGMEGAGVALSQMFGSHPNPEVRAAYEAGRQRTLDEQKEVQKQQPTVYLGGELVGTALTPGFGAGTAGTLPARLATGAIAGGAGGALYGAGSALGEGGGASEVAKGAVKGGVIGAPLGGVLKGAVGPRVAQVAEKPGEIAARKGAEIGAELPRGFTGGQFKAATTAALQSSPFSGQVISGRVKKFGEKFGEHIANTAAEMTGGSAGRESANVFVKGGLNQVIENNKTAQGALYDRVRSLIDTDTHYTLPRTDQALNEITLARSLAGKTNPAAGLEQFRNVAGGAPFAGAHRARAEARNPSQFTINNPGYDAGDFRKLYAAMSADLQELVTVAAKPGKSKEALAAFQQAEKEFGELADQNKFLEKLTKADGTAAIEKLIGASKERGGNVAILAQLRQKMSADDFAQIGGTVLNELGKSGPAGEFSPARFATDWGKLSEGAKRTLFSPAHVQDIDEFVGSAKYLTKALERSNRAHTAGALLVFDTLKTIAEFAIAAGAGAVDPTAGLVTGGGVAASHVLTLWLASPSKAASMRAWGNAYRGVLDNPTPARIAGFKIATRNLSNNIGVPVDKIMGAVQSKSEEQPGSDQK